MIKNHLKTVDERLNTYIKRIESCWVWTGYKNQHGYGRITNDEGKQVRAHRYLYETFKGKIPKGMCVLHTCDNRACVNPEHLFLGDRKDNADDMTNKGRNGYKTFYGQSHHNSKLTKEQVVEMRNLWEKGGVYQSQLAKKYGVTQQVVSKVVNFKAWKTLEGSKVIKINQ